MLELPVDQLVRIVANGGGLEVDAARMRVDDIVRIAANASSSRAQIEVINANRLTPDELVRVAANSKGTVFFRS